MANYEIWVVEVCVRLTKKTINAVWNVKNMRVVLMYVFLWITMNTQRNARIT